MNIIGIAACVAGIAHTYIAKEKLTKAAEKRGHTIHIETQGQIGTEDELTAEQIKISDVVILAVDTSIKGRDRFAGKKIVEVSTEVVIHSAGNLIKHIEENIKA
ncbi:PTS system, fructose-specific IIB component [Propionispira arboris]|uniref:PTS system, fructose-specific IIB component n=1 Tax=Propionispira arboris TaxID=84035 RepID=A0A1H6ZEI5_9FIRM|nr:MULTISPECIES: fructose PTS transporter subunit IIB [Propionispira]SEJ47950.1 PTS system, fructose-specific IIB component [Propionispira arboris]